MAFSTSVKRKICTVSTGKEVDSLKVDMLGEEKRLK
jgi:hypothetical protein